MLLVLLRVSYLIISRQRGQTAFFRKNVASNSGTPMAKHELSRFGIKCGIRCLGQIPVHSGNDPKGLVVALQALVRQEAGRNMLDEGLKGTLGLLHELQALLGLPELLLCRVQGDARLRLAEGLDPPEYPGQARVAHPTDEKRQESGLRRLLLRGFSGKLAIQLPFRSLYRNREGLGLLIGLQRDLFVREDLGHEPFDFEDFRGLQRLELVALQKLVEVGADVKEAPALLELGHDVLALAGWQLCPY